MDEINEAYQAKIDHLLGSIDYAIKIINDIGEKPDCINYNEHNLENIENMLRDIQREIKEM